MPTDIYSYTGKKYADETPENRARRLRRNELQRAYARKQRSTVDGWCRYIIREIRQRSKAKSLAFDITPADIKAIMPSDLCCPCLGTSFEFGGGYSDASPSVDQIIPSKGYVKGNIAIISIRANRIKYDADSIELFKVAEWVKLQEDKLLEHF